MKRSTFLALLAVALPTITVPVLSTQAQSPKPVKVTPPPAAKVALATGTWNLDPVHSQIGFAVTHVMVNEVHGTFDDFVGTIVADGKDVSKSSVQFTAKVASINTRVQQRDDHLRSPDFFDAATFPELSFKSIKVRQIGNDTFQVAGMFTMHGVTKRIEFPFTVAGPVVDGFGYTRGGIRAKFDINRQDYGVKWNQVLDNGGLAVDNIVHVNLDLEAIKAGTGPKKPE